ncbi:MAG: hypothetical protein L0216_12510 [Planctomycetales bacterium]|nr:hypothetical protein [Planctomycetales bacterium]
MLRRCTVAIGAVALGALSSRAFAGEPEPRLGLREAILFPQEPVPSEPGPGGFAPAGGPAGPEEAQKPLRFQVAGAGAYGGTGDASGYVFDIEFEAALGKPFGLAGAIVHYGYEWDNGEDLAPGNEAEEEEGSGTGIGVEWRWYASGKAFHGFFLGAGATLFVVADWEFKGDANMNGTYEPSEIEEGDNAVFELHATLGVTIRIGRVFGLTPYLIFGNFFSSSPEAGIYGGVGLRGGFAF